MTHRTTPALRLAGLGLGLALMAPLPAALAFGEFEGMLYNPCSTFTTCTAAVFSAAHAGTLIRFNNVVGNYRMPDYIVPGDNGAWATEQLETTAAIRVALGELCSNCYTDGPFWSGAAAQAQSDFGVNRGYGATTFGAAGNDVQSDGRAVVRIETTGMTDSAWRDVWTFSANGHFNTTIRVDGDVSRAEGNPVFPSTFHISPGERWSEWQYGIKVWDVDNLTPDADHELAPTLVGAASLSEIIAWDFGDSMPRPFESLLSLGFDFTAGVQYVVIAQLRLVARDGHTIDIYNTARLTDVTLSNGASLSALSGHDYLAPVPEPQTLALLLAGLASLALRRSAGRP